MCQPECCRHHIVVQRVGGRDNVVSWALCVAIEEAGIRPACRAARESSCRAFSIMEASGASELNSYVPEGSRIDRSPLGGSCPEIPRISVYHHVNVAVTRVDSSVTLFDLTESLGHNEAPCIRRSPR